MTLHDQRSRDIPTVRTKPVKRSSKVSEQNARARAKRAAKAEAKRAAKLDAGIPVRPRRVAKTRPGSDRRAEQRARDRMRNALEALREDVEVYAEMLRADQGLVDRLETEPSRADARAAAALPAPSPTDGVLAQYLALLSHLSYTIKDMEKGVDQLDKLETLPRMVPLVAEAEASTDDYVISMIDAQRFQVMTRSLHGYGISANDYRRIFGLADDYILWTEKVKQARSDNISENRVWERPRKQL